MLSSKLNQPLVTGVKGFTGAKHSGTYHIDSAGKQEDLSLRDPLPGYLKCMDPLLREVQEARFVTGTVHLRGLKGV